MLSLIRGEVREKGGKKGEERWKRGRGEKGRKSIWPGQIMSSVTLRVFSAQNHNKYKHVGIIGNR